MEIRVNEEDHLALLLELKHLRRQRDELQENNTRLELENLDLRTIVGRLDYLRRVDQLPGPTPREVSRFRQCGAQSADEAAADELRRWQLWKHMRVLFGAGT